MKTGGQIAYEAMLERQGVDPLRPSWDDLDASTRKAWRDVAQAIAEHLGYCAPADHGEPPAGPSGVSSPPKQQTEVTWSNIPEEFSIAERRRHSALHLSALIANGKATKQGGTELDQTTIHRAQVFEGYLAGVQDA